MALPQSHRKTSFAVPGRSAFRHGQTRSEMLASMLARGFPYSSKLTAHTSCVNALTFSSGDGRFLASGGDDLNILLWDFHQDDVKTPSYCFHGPRGNVFTLAFSAHNRFLLSGGTDETVLKYDIGRMDSAPGHQSQSHYHSFKEHKDSIRSITCHPFQDEVFMSASEDGRIIRRDGRVGVHSTRAQDTLQLTTEVTGVQYHPQMEHIFVTSESRGDVCLRDSRMTFGPLSSRTGQGVVCKYTTLLTRGPSLPSLCNPESSSVTFDREGSMIAVTMQHYLPTLYALTDPQPVAICSGRNLPDGTPVSAADTTYSNSCTMKHGSFGGPGLDRDSFYAAGSDDFRGYIWGIPTLSNLLSKRREVSADRWIDQDRSQTAFTTGTWKPRYIPIELGTPLCRLTGHKSIVNTILFHPHLLHVVTSGIEKSVTLHSPTASSPCARGMQRTSTDVRRVSPDSREDQDIYFRALTHGAEMMEDDSDDSEQNTIRMFDYILREEGEADVFSMRKFFPDSDSEEEQDVENSDVPM
ncbi:WD40-repeat-containing domain protein [Infundibulicybe gibba]|nr:WD40-repeat-containing domain protein [Infundibulicybe gibba]